MLFAVVHLPFLCEKIIYYKFFQIVHYCIERVRITVKNIILPDNNSKTYSAFGQNT